MNKVTQFTLIFIITLLLTRVGVYLGGLIFTHWLKLPLPENTFFGIRIHHYVFGIILMLIGYLIKNTALSAVGMALFIDELTFLIIGGKTHEDNYSFVSILGTIILGGLVIIFRRPLFQLFQK